MAYRFARTDPSVADAIRRIAVEQVAEARLALSGSQPLVTRVHSVRKSIKMLRGLIRLVRPHFPAFAAENEALRQIGRVLSPLRESHVARALLADLVKRSGLDPAVFESPGAPVGPDPEGPLAAAEADLAALAARIPRWVLDGPGGEALWRAGLVRTWNDARAAMKAALAEPTAETMHEWRKRAKDHWYHARLLEPIWPPVMAAHINQTDLLGETLGQYHDLCVLEPVLACAPLLKARAEAEKSEHLQLAARLGPMVLAGPAKALADRWQAWWRLADPALPTD